MVHLGPPAPKKVRIEGTTSKFGSKMKPPSRISALGVGPLTGSFYAAGPRNKEEIDMYKWLEEYRLQQYFLPIRRSFRCDFVKICDYLKPFASFNRLDGDCANLAQEKLFHMLNMADKDKDTFVRAIVEDLQKEPPLEVFRVDNSTRAKLFSADEVANLLEEINKTVEI